MKMGRRRRRRGKRRGGGGGEEEEEEEEEEEGWEGQGGWREGGWEGEGEGQGEVGPDASPDQELWEPRAQEHLPQALPAQGQPAEGMRAEEYKSVQVHLRRIEDILGVPKAEQGLPATDAGASAPTTEQKDSTRCLQAFCRSRGAPLGIGTDTGDRSRDAAGLTPERD